jgi:hypothetical protein
MTISMIPTTETNQKKLYGRTSTPSIKASKQNPKSNAVNRNPLLARNPFDRPSGAEKARQEPQDFAKNGQFALEACERRTKLAILLTCRGNYFSRRCPLFPACVQIAQAMIVAGLASRMCASGSSAGLASVRFAAKNVKLDSGKLAINYGSMRTARP